MTQQLKYGDKSYPVRISYYAIKNFQQETGKNIEDLDEDITHLESLLFYSLVAGHKAEGKELELKREEMEFVLDECLQQFNDLILGFFPYAQDSDGNLEKKK